MNVLLIITIVYLLGAVKTYISFRILSKEWRMHTKREAHLECIKKAIIWPYETFSYYSPLEFFSETFFKHYGDKGNIYFGTKGLNNFLRDMFLGKNRYKDAMINHFIVKLNDSHPIKKEHCLGDHMEYMMVIVGKKKDNYFYLFAISHDKPKDTKPSRYLLDTCHQVSEEELYNELTQTAGLPQAREIIACLSMPKTAY